MTQLLLKIAPEWVPTLDNFVSGQNRELVYLLRHALLGEGERSIYLWGATGSGKSHLLQATVSAAHELGLSAEYTQAEVPKAANVIAVDDVQQLDGEAQIELFALFNQMRETGSLLLVSGTAAPMHLGVRDDLSTRLGWGLVYEVHGLSEQEKAQALQHHAQARGLELPSEVTQYLLRHGRRDLPALLETLDALDQLCLRLKRWPSVPLLREVMQEANQPDFPR